MKSPWIERFYKLAWAIAAGTLSWMVLQVVLEVVLSFIPN